MKTSTTLEQAHKILKEVQEKKVFLEKRIELAIRLAGCILDLSKNLQTEKERQFQAELGRMVKDEKGKAFVTELSDQCFRSKSNLRSADQLQFILKKYGVPSFFSLKNKILFFLLKYFMRFFPNLLFPYIRHQIRHQSLKVILPGEADELKKHLEKRKKEQVRLNLNRIGEAILGEDEANRRLHLYLSDLANPEIEYISIKISTIYSQINLLADEESLSILSERLRKLFRVSQKHTYKNRPKFVNLDMEEYKDLRFTVELFKKVLSEPEFLSYSAGIVLQSYLPDSFAIQQEITQWATQRLSEGGAPIKIRLVKGANLAMEKVEASLRNWNVATYESKAKTDANFMRMLSYALTSEHLKAVHIGIGSHNLFDISYAILLCYEQKISSEVSFEMLEGMAEPQRRSVQKLVNEMLLYCPVVKEEQFQHAIAYLIRRLDENTAPENFLSVSFDLKVDSKEWQEQATLFAAACRKMNTLSSLPKRTQNRNLPATSLLKNFDNEPDTDFSLAQNCVWAKEILKKSIEEIVESIPLVINAQEIYQTREMGECKDPSKNQIYCTYALMEPQQLNEALDCAVEAAREFRKWKVFERLDLLAKIAQGFRAKRGHLIGVMCRNCAKTVSESDTEISEAIDFAEYYRRSAEELHAFSDIRWRPKGVVLVTPPWNFPVSIPAGGILAALATGNAVIFKPAPEAVEVGYEIAKIFWEAGVSKKVLQFIPCLDEPTGNALIRDSRVNTVILTGSTNTAKHFLRLRPKLDLMAETGGKNAIIVTRLADKDLAIKDIIQSAFGYGGQKCSACSLLILEKEVYEDLEFRKHLRDAANSLVVGSSWDPATKINPLINPPKDALKKGISKLESGEEWLLEPKQDLYNPHLLSPGIKLGVKMGSFTQQTELFGPILGVISADNLEDAIRIANATNYGLTSGLHSLDDREKELWMKKIVSGNCYINRGITGAIVLRQPFGGTKDSSFGKGAKAGGPNYLTQLMWAEQVGEPIGSAAIPPQIKILYKDQGLIKEEIETLKKRVQNYIFYYQQHFSKDHDPLRILGQDNLFRYVPHERIILRVSDQDSLIDLLSVLTIAILIKLNLEISVDSLNHKGLNFKELLKFSNVHFFSEKEDELVKRIKSRPFNRLRFFTEPSDSLAEKLAQLSCRLQIGPVLANGRLELLHYFREVVFSIDYHRYGNLGLRESEIRKK